MPDRESPDSVADTVASLPGVAKIGVRHLETVFRSTEYDLVEPIGQGGMGTVYRAVHRRLQRNVAVKVLADRRSREPRAIGRFKRETAMIGRLDHANLVRGHDAGEVDGMYYLVMELVDGVDANVLTKLRSPLAIADACEIARQAALGLAYISQQGLVHRDIKPSNLLLSRDGVVKIADLGMTRLEAWRESEGLLTETNEVVGTVDFMAPEQAKADAPVGIQADIYALGCTLFYLLTGRVLFPSPSYDTPIKKMMAHIHEPPPDLAELRVDAPLELRELLSRMLAKEPEARPDRPTTVASELAPLAEGHALPELAAEMADVVSVKSELTESGGLPPVDLHYDLATVRHTATPEDQQRVAAEAKKRWLDGATPRRRSRPRAWVFAVLLAAMALGGWTQADRWVPLFIGRDQAEPTVADEWEKELGRLPVALEYPGQHGDTEWRFNEKRRALELISVERRLIQLGEITKLPCQIEVDIERPVWDEGVGLFFGYHVVDGPAGTTARLHLIELAKEIPFRGPTKFKVLRKKTVISPDSLSMPPDRIPFADPVAWPPAGQAQRLFVRIDSGGISHVQWAGQDLTEVVSARCNAQFQADEYLGAWGLYQRDGTTWFGRPKLRYDVEEPSP